MQLHFFPSMRSIIISNINGRVGDLRKIKIATMVHFKDYISPSSNNKYLLIEADDGAILSKPLTHTPLAEDILARIPQTLMIAKVYDVVYASLFSYDQSSTILQVFIEVRCSRTNTLLTLAGELFISLWDLHKIDGLPIGGLSYEKVVPEFKGLTGVDEKNERFIPRTFEFLFLAFQCLHEGESHNPRVTLSKWIKFWCKRVLRYEAAPGGRSTCGRSMPQL
ncbi:hypothetical protein FXO38_24767 [Capsicum annuum]|nr:hypothetical protein FXO38_24767 [Capsicum annuum]